MNRTICALLLVALVSVAGCQPKPDEKEGIRQGVINYLSNVRGLNLPAMNITVTQATVNGNQATAQVEIKAKNDSGGNMQLSYSLEKRGNEWVVLKSAPAGGSLQHPAPGTPMSGSALPPGHPDTSGGSTTPHSDFSDIMKPSQPPASAPPSSSAPATPPQKP